MALAALKSPAPAMKPQSNPSWLTAKTFPLLIFKAPCTNDIK